MYWIGTREGTVFEPEPEPDPRLKGRRAWKEIHWGPLVSGECKADSVVRRRTVSKWRRFYVGFYLGQKEPDMIICHLLTKWTNWFYTIYYQSNMLVGVRFLTRRPFSLSFHAWRSSYVRSTSVAICFQASFVNLYRRWTVDTQQFLLPSFCQNMLFFNNIVCFLLFQKYLWVLVNLED